MSKTTNASIVCIEETITVETGRANEPRKLTRVRQLSTGEPVPEGATLTDKAPHEWMEVSE